MVNPREDMVVKGDTADRHNNSMDSRSSTDNHSNTADRHQDKAVTALHLGTSHDNM